MASQFLVNTSTNLEITVYVDGTATDADADTVTLGVTDAAGTTVVAAGTAYTSKNGTGVYRYLLSPQTQVAELTATWSVTVSGVVQTLVTNHEVVGGFLFTEDQARNFGALTDDTGPLGSATEYPDSLIARHRAEITDLLESWTGVSWVPRYHRETLPGTGATTVLPTKRLLSTLITATDTGSDVSSNVSILNQRTLWRTSGTWTRPTQSNPHNVTVAYRHGYENNPYGVTRIALLLLQARIVPSTLPANALSFDSEFGATRLVQAGGPARNFTNLPEVNQWLDDHRWRVAV